MILAIWLTLAAFAEDPVPEGPDLALEALPPPGPPPSPEQAQILAREVGSGLRCPVCQGLSVADSPSPTARQMFERVVELTEKGYTREQIEDYFVARYGEWVLLSPPVQGNSLVWLGPALAAGIGLGWVAVTIGKWRKEPEALPSDLGELPKDDYERRLLAELDEPEVKK